MNISVEITFTPLHDQYRERIKNFIIDLMKMAGLVRGKGEGLIY